MTDISVFYKAISICGEDVKDRKVVESVLSANTRITPWRITELEPNEILVFGANSQGKHDRRTSKMAKEKFGAKEHHTDELFTNSYAFTTDFRVENYTRAEKLERIRNSAEKLLGIVKEHPDKTFYITRVGCGKAGFKVEEIAKNFEEFVKYSNVYLPQNFIDVIFGRELPGGTPSVLVPIQSQGVGSFSEKLETQLYLYQRWLTRESMTLFRTEKERVAICDKVDEICNAIVTAVSQYLRGLPAAAYWEISNLFRNPEDSDRKNEGKISFKDLLSCIPANKTFFRMREEKGNWKKKEIDEYGMFHIPFSMRGSVRTQRYSVPGYPCLYLGERVEGCWEELGRPNMSDCLISKVQSQSKFSVLDLSIPRDTDWKKGSMGLKDRVLLFPFVVASTFIASDPTIAFKPEYIIPQIMLQFAKDSAYKDGMNNKEQAVVYGIKYTSVHIQSGLKQGKDPSYYSNYVIPVHGIKHEYCARLCKMFTISKPLCVEYERTGISNDPNRNQSLFGQIEDLLSNAPMLSILPDGIK